MRFWYGKTKAYTPIFTWGIKTKNTKLLSIEFRQFSSYTLLLHMLKACASNWISSLLRFAQKWGSCIISRQFERCCWRENRFWSGAPWWEYRANVAVAPLQKRGRRSRGSYNKTLLKSQWHRNAKKIVVFTFCIFSAVVYLHNSGHTGMWNNVLTVNTHKHACYEHFKKSVILWYCAI